ncbi:hypothetical protein BD408DRAFT_418193, partial [Parasitella parasitica]
MNSVACSPLSKRIFFTIVFAFLITLNLWIPNTCLIIKSAAYFIKKSSCCQATESEETQMEIIAVKASLPTGVVLVTVFTKRIYYYWCFPGPIQWTLRFQHDISGFERA